MGFDDLGSFQMFSSVLFKDKNTAIWFLVKMNMKLSQLTLAKYFLNNTFYIPTMISPVNR